MPIAATSLSATSFLRLLVLGMPRVGKTTTILSTSPGPKYVILADARDGTPLKGAARLVKDFEYDIVQDAASMNAAIVTARSGVEKGKYKTVILDTLSMYSAFLIEQCLKQSEGKSGEPNPMQAYPAHERRLRHTVNTLTSLQAHVIVLSHFEKVEGTLDNQMKKSGDGIVPAVAGAARQRIAAMFSDVLFMDLVQGERVFYCNPRGSWGPGSRSLDTTEAVPADINGLLTLIARAGKMPGNAPAKPATSTAAAKVGQTKAPILGAAKQR